MRRALEVRAPLSAVDTGDVHIVRVTVRPPMRPRCTSAGPRRWGGRVCQTVHGRDRACASTVGRRRALATPLARPAGGVDRATHGRAASASMCCRGAHVPAYPSGADAQPRAPRAHSLPGCHGGASQAIGTLSEMNVRMHAARGPVWQGARPMHGGAGPHPGCAGRARRLPRPHAPPWRRGSAMGCTRRRWRHGPEGGEAGVGDRGTRLGRWPSRSGGRPGRTSLLPLATPPSGRSRPRRSACRSAGPWTGPENSPAAPTPGVG